MRLILQHCLWELTMATPLGQLMWTSLSSFTGHFSFSNTPVYTALHALSLPALTRQAVMQVAAYEADLAALPVGVDHCHAAGAADVDVAVQRHHMGLIQGAHAHLRAHSNSQQGLRLRFWGRWYRPGSQGGQAPSLQPCNDSQSCFLSCSWL